MARLEEFDRSAILDGPSLRREIGRVRSACRAGSRAGSREKPIADDTWSLWRSIAGVERGALFVNQYQAIVICYQAFYGFSGKHFNGGKNLNGVAIETIPELAEQWLDQVVHPRICEAIGFILRSALTPGQIEHEQLLEFRRTRVRLSVSKVLKARAKKCLASRSRPRYQRFIREIVCRTVFRPQ